MSLVGPEVQEDFIVVLEAVRDRARKLCVGIVPHRARDLDGLVSDKAVHEEYRTLPIRTDSNCEKHSTARFEEREPRSFAIEFPTVRAIFSSCEDAHCRRTR